MTTLVLQFEKIKNDNKTIYSTFCLNSKAERIINESNIDDVFKSIYKTVYIKHTKVLRKGSGWIIYSVIDDNINKTVP